MRSTLCRAIRHGLGLEVSPWLDSAELAVAQFRAWDLWTLGVGVGRP